MREDLESDKQEIRLWGKRMSDRSLRAAFCLPIAIETSSVGSGRGSLTCEGACSTYVP
ncbi:protein of unknown function (plasmid) [Cupriavidus taiwanensis]|uniref:Uncharacterized protein n=1 Tax=Cupriavidus taiwanensis TaxID=164546 RepID=A0A375IRI7_9BURK|nr:protein of unknown function [Cupriavidus taiwanensis]